MFSIEREIQFYETDLMGIVHHSNYLRYCEEARVAWAKAHGFITQANASSAGQFAVLETQVRHLKPLQFGDRLRCELQCKLEKVKLIFEYKIFSASSEVLVCEARTQHVSMDQANKLQRPSRELAQHMEKETWTETWLLSL